MTVLEGQTKLDGLERVTLSAGGRSFCMTGEQFDAGVKELKERLQEAEGVRDELGRKMAKTANPYTGEVR